MQNYNNSNSEIDEEYPSLFPPNFFSKPPVHYSAEFFHFTNDSSLKLIVVDSIADIFDILPKIPSGTKEQRPRITTIANKLRKIAEEYNLSVLTTNHAKIKKIKTKKFIFVPEQNQQETEGLSQNPESIEENQMIQKEIIEIQDSYEVLGTPEWISFVATRIVLEIGDSNPESRFISFLKSSGCSKYERLPAAVGEFGFFYVQNQAQEPQNET